MAVPYDVVVIGGGSGGLVVASAASQLKAKVLLVERDRLGGDCLWYGCVPSKSLIHMADMAHTARRALQTGLLRSGSGSGVAVDYGKVFEHIQSAQGHIAEHDSAERFRKLGAEVEFGVGQFVDRHTFAINGRQIKARAFVIATGSRPQTPAIPGLAEVGYLTNERLFDLTQCPRSVVVIGAGPIGCEIGQSLARLGSEVTLVASREQILPKEDPEAALVVQRQFEAEGIRILRGSRAEQAMRLSNGQKQLRVNGKDLVCDEILVAAGRVPNVESLDLEAARVQYGQDGIRVNAKLQTSNPRIYACGDVIGGYQFTHVAGYEAAVALVNALFFPLSKANYRVIPWATFTDPELARVGLTEQEARKAYADDVQVLKHDFAETDRGQAEGATLGFAKILCRNNGQILGAHLVGSHAGELLHEVVLAMNYKLPVSALSGIHVYPTLSEVNAKAALILKKRKFANSPWQQDLLQKFFDLRRAWA